jgi:2-polyprenyl-3-methyl-5-hydroxy-6-metoxy-1,4-benzoquinol methylase
LTERAYEGGELTLFARAVNWKAYLRRCFAPHLRGSVLEVGAGSGSNSLSLSGSSAAITRWTCLEPDPRLAEEIRARKLPVEVRVGLSSSLSTSDLFDTILYVDVLEHIEHDAAEAKRMASHLNAGGRLVVLAPAHQFLFSPFDKAVGHFRRYNKASLRAAMSGAGLRERELYYLDSVGLLASLANRLLMQQAMPTAGQISFWDGALVRASCLMDVILGFSLGKSVLGVWEKA